MFDENFQYAIDLTAIESAAVVKTYGTEPKLGDLVIPFHVDMLGFISISGIEEEPVRPRSQYSRHYACLFPCPSLVTWFKCLEAKKRALKPLRENGQRVRARRELAQA